MGREGIGTDVDVQTAPTKEALLSELQTERQKLLKILDGVPEDDLEIAGPAGGWSGMDILAHITAWDGEALRRLAFATGESARRPHDLEDTAYWQRWNEEQVALKRMLGPKGVKVDMAGTWVRLLATIEGLHPLDYARWQEVGTGIRPGHDAEHAAQLRAWREHWEQSLPWWRRVKRRLLG